MARVNQLIGSHGHLGGTFTKSGNGVVAQLGERGLCKPEVVGSIPIDSTIFLHGRRAG